VHNEYRNHHLGCNAALMGATNVSMKSPIHSKPALARQKGDAQSTITPARKVQTANNSAVIATARSLPFSHKRWFVANPNVSDSALND